MRKTVTSFFRNSYKASLLDVGILYRCAALFSSCLAASDELLCGLFPSQCDFKNVFHQDCSRQNQQAACDSETQALRSNGLYYCVAIARWSVVLGRLFALPDEKPIPGGLDYAFDFGNREWGGGPLQPDVIFMISIHMK